MALEDSRYLRWGDRCYLAGGTSSTSSHIGQKSICYTLIVRGVLQSSTSPAGSLRVDLAGDSINAFGGFEEEGFSNYHLSTGMPPYKGMRRYKNSDA